MEVADFSGWMRPIAGSVLGFAWDSSRVVGAGAFWNCPDGRFGAGAGTPRGVGAEPLAGRLPLPNHFTPHFRDRY